MDKTTIYLPAELHATLRDLAKRTGKPQATLIREAVAAYVVDAVEEEFPWPKSAGMVEGLSATSETLEEWLAENWHPE